MATKAKLLEKHIKDLAKLQDKTVEAGWFETNRYDDGTSVAKVARINEFGGTVTVKAHTVTIYREIKKDGEFKNGGKFVKAKKSNFATEHQVPEHTIKIPARPFMRLAATKFAAKRRELTAAIARKMAEGKITAAQGLAQIGGAMEGCIVDSIKNGGWEKNAAPTVAKKGFDRPLVETAEMFKSVSSKVS